MKKRYYIKWRNIFIAVGFPAFIVLVIIIAMHSHSSVNVPGSSEIDRYKALAAEQEYDRIHAEARAKLEAEESEKSREIYEAVAEIDRKKAEAERSKVLNPYVETIGVSANTEAEIEPEVQPEVDTTVNSTVWWTDDDVRILTLAVQHEVGKTDSYTPYSDFDYVQRLMASVIINRVGNPTFGMTLTEVLLQKNQFPGLLDDINNWQNMKNSEQMDPWDERTRANVLAVLNGEDDIPDNLYYEFSSVYQPEISVDVQYSIRVDGLFLATPILYRHIVASDGRICYFAVDAA